MDYYTAEEVYSELGKGIKPNGLKFEDFIYKKGIYEEIAGNKLLISRKPLKRNSENPLISGLGIYTGWRAYNLGDSTITDFSTDSDEIEIKYYFGNQYTNEKGVKNDSIFIPLDKLTSNRHFVFVFCIKNGNVMLYNIYCTIKGLDDKPIGYINPTFYKEIKFIIATNDGFVYYNYTDDLTRNLKKDNPDLILSQVSCYPKFWDEDLYVLDNKGVRYHQDILVLNNKIKPIVYIPLDRFKTCYIGKENNFHNQYRDLVDTFEPLDFDKDEDYYDNYPNYCIRKGIKIKRDSMNIDE